MTTNGFPTNYLPPLKWHCISMPLECTFDEIFIRAHWWWVYSVECSVGHQLKTKHSKQQWGNLQPMNSSGGLFPNAFICLKVLEAGYSSRHGPILIFKCHLSSFNFLTVIQFDSCRFPACCAVSTAMWEPSPPATVVVRYNRKSCVYDRIVVVRSLHSTVVRPSPT